MICLQCGERMNVVRTRQREGGRVNVRRYKCAACLNKVSTVEQIVHATDKFAIEVFDQTAVDDFRTTIRNRLTIMIDEAVEQALKPRRLKD
jgi:transcriptional regulator NrdR family protein